MKEITIILSSTWKFAATIPFAIYLMKMSFFETILFTNIGGILGILVFGVLSKGLLKAWEICMPAKFKDRIKKRAVFSKRSRRIVSLKLNYGLPGIVILTPVILSIPLGVFLIAKYFNKSLKNYLWLFCGLIIWSIIYTSLYIWCKPLLLPLFS